MLYLAMAHNAENINGEDLMERSRGWWNEGKRPEGLTLSAAYRTVGSGTSDVYIFETDDHEDLQKLVSYWRGIVEFEFHPAFDAVEQWRAQGMDVPATPT